MSERRNKAAAAAPPMDGQTAWPRGVPVPIEEPPSPAQIAETERKLGEILHPPASEGVAGNGVPGPESKALVHYGSNRQAECGADNPDLTKLPYLVTCPKCRGYLPIVAPEMQKSDTSNAGGKRKGPRPPRTAARASVYLERQIMRYPLAQRRAIYSLLASVCEAMLTDPENGAKP